MSVFPQKSLSRLHALYGDEWIRHSHASLTETDSVLIALSTGKIGRAVVLIKDKIERGSAVKLVADNLEGVVVYLCDMQCCPCTHCTKEQPG